MKNLITGLFKNNKIRRKLIIYFMITTFLMALVSFYTHFNARMLTSQMDTMFSSNFELDELKDSMDNVQLYLESFLDTKHSDSLRNFIDSKTKLQKHSSTLLKTADYSQSGLVMRDIGNMIDNYLTKADSAVLAKRGRDISKYIGYYNESNKLYGYIELYINKLNNNLLKENTSRYQTVSNRIEFIQMLNIFIIIGVVLFNIIFILLTTYKTTKPLVKLSTAANEISKGNFDFPDVSVSTDDEISVMAEAFNKMTHSIREHIDDLQEKAQLERKLKEQELQNLTMKNHLREAELQALQSQINPHFIFNTLNAGAQIAMMEGADKTCFFVENVANLFRYNLKKLDRPVTLSEEINNISIYIFILKTRFGDRIEFEQNIQTDDLDMPMPCMVLQPIVENAFIHGISDYETGGKITLSVSTQDEFLHVTVSDNGVGMSEQRLQKLLGIDDQNDSVSENKDIIKGHTTGIGMKNVISRLKIFYGTEDIISIKTSPGCGTSVCISIPLSVKETGYVQNAHS